MRLISDMLPMMIADGAGPVHGASTAGHRTSTSSLVSTDTRDRFDMALFSIITLGINGNFAPLLVLGALALVTSLLR